MLYGDNLGKAVRAGCTYQQATDILGVIEKAINDCYSSLTLYSNWKASGTLDTINLAVLSAIVPEDAAAVKPELDTELAGLWAFDTMVQSEIAAGQGDAPLPDDYLTTLQAHAASASITVNECDSLFHTSVLQQVNDAIVPVVGNFADKIAATLSTFLGNLIAGLWPYLLGASVVAYLVLRKKVA